MQLAIVSAIFKTHVSFCSYTLLLPHLLSEIMGELLAAAVPVGCLSIVEIMKFAAQVRGNP